MDQSSQGLKRDMLSRIRISFKCLLSYAALKSAPQSGKLRYWVKKLIKSNSIHKSLPDEIWKELVKINAQSLLLLRFIVSQDSVSTRSQCGITVSV